MKAKKKKIKKKLSEEGSDDEGFDDNTDEDIEGTMDLSEKPSQEELGMSYLNPSHFNIEPLLTVLTLWYLCHSLNTATAMW